MPDRAPLGLGILDAAQRVEEARRRVDRHELDADVRAHGALHLLALVQPQQASVDEHAGELIADRAVHERRGDGRIHAAGQPADHLRVADERADLRDLVLDERARRPARRRAADVEQEVREHLPPRGVCATSG